MNLPRVADRESADAAHRSKPDAASAACIRVVEFVDGDSAEWDRYVAQADGLPMQLSGWREIIAATFGVEPRYLRATQSDRTVGVLPMYLLRSRIAGHVARSMPGGLCTDGSEAAEGLIEAAQEVARDAGMARLELHDARVAWPGLAAASEHVAWRVDLSGGAEGALERLDRNVRRQVRMAERNGLGATSDREGRDLTAFYEVLRRSMHAQGTPIFGRDFFERAWAAFPGRCSTLVVRHGGQPVAGFFQMEMGRGAFGLWGGSLPEARDLRAGYLAYREIIRDAADRGLAFLDMGRSPRASGASEFKAQWGGAPAAVYQQALGLAGAGESDQPVAPGGAYRGLAQWWRRLPLGMACVLGPAARRRFPFG
jgi:FemAB-related protein (PEP-CTERM system-associated)